MERIKKILKKIWSNRPFRTFIQGFVGTLTGAYLVDVDINGLKALIISAIMAGISAVMSLNTGEE
jgi:hypothetical protein